MEEPVMESTQAEEQKDAEVGGVEEIKGTEEVKELLAGSDNRNMPEIEVDYFIYEYHDGIFTEKRLEVISFYGSRSSVGMAVL